MNKKRVFFYSSCKTMDLFKIQQFYVIDISILEKMGFVVTPTNRIRDFFKFWQYDYGFYYFYKKSFFAALIAKVFFKKNYFTGGIDDFVSSNRKEFLRQKIFFLLSYIVSNKCILVSESDSNNIRKIYHNRLKKKLFFSFHGIDLNNCICNEAEYKNKENIFTTIVWQGVKSNVIRKGVDKALKIYSELKRFDEFANSSFYIMGKCGEGTQYLKELCNEYNITSSVVFTDEVTELEKINLLKRSKFYFQLSIYEGFGVAALEALAAKNIVLHSGKGGLQDVIGNDGVYISDNQKIESIKKMIEDYDTAILKQAEKRILLNFSIEKRQKDFEQIIKK